MSCKYLPAKIGIHFLYVHSPSTSKLELIVNVWSNFQIGCKKGYVLALIQGQPPIGRTASVKGRTLSLDLCQEQQALSISNSFCSSIIQHIFSQPRISHLSRNTDSRFMERKPQLIQSMKSCRNQGSCLLFFIYISSAKNRAETGVLEKPLLNCSNQKSLIRFHVDHFRDFPVRIH